MSTENTVTSNAAPTAATPGAGKSRLSSWTRRAVDGTVGIVVGSIATMAATAGADDDVEVADVAIDDTQVTVDGTQATASTPAATASAATAPAVSLDEAHLATGVNDNMSFSQAFAAARAEVGAGGVFAWHGSLYGTYYETEWNAMSHDERAAYYASISPDVKADAATSYAHESTHHHHHDAPHNHVTGGDDVTMVTGGDDHEGGVKGGDDVTVVTGGDDTEGESNFRVLGEIEGEDGKSYTKFEVDGHTGVVINKDDEPVVAIIDVDDSGSITPPDIVIDMETGEGATIEQLAAAQAELAGGSGDLGIIDDAIPSIEV